MQHDNHWLINICCFIDDSMSGTVKIKGLIDKWVKYGDGIQNNRRYRRVIWLSRNDPIAANQSYFLFVITGRPAIIGVNRARKSCKQWHNTSIEECKIEKCWQKRKWNWIRFQFDEFSISRIEFHLIFAVCPPDIACIFGRRKPVPAQLCKYFVQTKHI